MLFLGTLLPFLFSLCLAQDPIANNPAGGSQFENRKSPWKLLPALLGTSLTVVACLVLCIVLFQMAPS